MSITVRMCFSKTGRAIYISHLDLIRCFQRAVCRAGLPAAYSEGFHPHMQTSFAATLPLGFSSTSEIMDLELEQEVPYEEVREKLNQTLPEDIQILRAGAPELAFKALACAEYSIRIPADQPELLAESLEQFLAQPAILTEKRSKKGMREVDLKPMILDAQTVCTASQLEVQLCLVCSSSMSLNPMLVLEAWKKSAGISAEISGIRRESLLTEQRKKFF